MTTSQIPSTTRFHSSVDPAFMNQAPINVCPEGRFCAEATEIRGKLTAVTAHLGRDGTQEGLYPLVVLGGKAPESATGESSALDFLPGDSTIFSRDLSCCGGAPFPAVNDSYVHHFELLFQYLDVSFRMPSELRDQTIRVMLTSRPGDPAKKGDKLLKQESGFVWCNPYSEEAVESANDQIQAKLDKTLAENQKKIDEAVAAIKNAMDQIVAGKKADVDQAKADTWFAIERAKTEGKSAYELAVMQSDGDKYINQIISEADQNFSKVISEGAVTLAQLRRTGNDELEEIRRNGDIKIGQIRHMCSNFGTRPIDAFVLERAGVVIPRGGSNPNFLSINVSPSEPILMTEDELPAFAWDFEIILPQRGMIAFTQDPTTITKHHEMMESFELSPLIWNGDFQVKVNVTKTAR